MITLIKIAKFYLECKEQNWRLHFLFKKYILRMQITVHRFFAETFRCWLCPCLLALVAPISTRSRDPLVALISTGGRAMQQAHRAGTQAGHK